MLTCKIKHLQNICKNVLELTTSLGNAVDVNVVKMFYYLREVNEVNGGDNVFVRCVSVCVCVCVQRTGQSDQFKTDTVNG